jgi:hypothetical protein
VVNVFDAYCDPLTSQAMQHCARVRTPTNAEPKNLNRHFIFAFQMGIANWHFKLACQIGIQIGKSNLHFKYAFPHGISDWHFKHRISNRHKNAFQICFYGISSWRFKFALQNSISIWQLTLAFQTGVST